MTNKYAKLPWSMEDTIENLKEIKEHLKTTVKRTNLHGKGEEDAKEIEFDFNRAIKALEKQIAKEPTYSEYDDNGFDEIIPHKAECPICGNIFEFGDWNEFDNHHCTCGQKIDWSVKK